MSSVPLFLSSTSGFNVSVISGTQNGSGGDGQIDEEDEGGRGLPPSSSSSICPSPPDPFWVAEMTETLNPDVGEQQERDDEEG